MNNIECATCHHEHRGSTADLLAISDTQCHQRTGNNEISRTASYRDACASCHDEAFRLQIAEGLTLPILPVNSAAKVQPWPEATTGFYNGTVSPFAELLLQADPEISAALQEIPNLDFAGVKTAASISAAEPLANGYRQLINEIARERQPALIKRSKLLGLTPDRLQNLPRPPSPQVVKEAQRNWFINRPATNTSPSANSAPTPDTKPERSKSSGPDELLGDPPDSNDLLGPDRLSDDSLLIPENNSDADPLALDPPTADRQLATDPLTGTNSSLADRPRSKSPYYADSMLPSGGWFRDDQGLSIRYRGSDHDDPVLKAMIDIIRQLPESMPTRDCLLKNHAIAACISCHPSAAQTGGKWYSQPQFNT